MKHCSCNDRIGEICKLSMMRQMPKNGDIWKHFKGNLYEIIASPVRHTETGELYVCYRALYGDYDMYCRPLTMFLSKTDKVKYPNATQEYRFERKI